MDFPELAARTHGFSSGTPRAVTVSPDGSRVVFLRSTGPTDPYDQLWIMDLPAGTERRVGPKITGDAPTPAEAALRERLRLNTLGVGGYSTDADVRAAVYTASGRLYRADLLTGEAVEVPTAGPVTDPRVDPTGRRIAYVTDGQLRVIHPDGQDVLLAGEERVTWGLAEFVAAEELGRSRGYWWAPDGERLLVTRVDEGRLAKFLLSDPSDPSAEPRLVRRPVPGGDNAQVSLHVLDLDGGWVDVHWDRAAYPYLVAAEWGAAGPLVTVLRRLQQHGLALTIDARTGETQVHAELSDPHWVEPVPGTPTRLPDGRVLLSGELVRDGLDARCLFADGALLTPPALYPRAICGLLDDGLLVAASEGEPSEQHLYLVSLAPSTAPRRLTSAPGWHTGVAAGSTYVRCSTSLDHPRPRWTVVTPTGEHELRSLAAEHPYAARPAFARVTDREIPTSVLYPTGHVPGQRRLPVLVNSYAGPSGQMVLARRGVWQERQWWAEQGFAVVTIDGRGTPGCSPQYEKIIHHRLADIALSDQCDALAALAAKHPDLDLDRVAIRGWSFGGWLAAAAVLRRPEVFHAAVAGAPVTEWELTDTAFTERYLGLPEEQPEVYARHNLLADAEHLSRPLLLIHGFADDNVHVAHTLKLSAALTAAGRPHSVLPLVGATHMGLNTLALELDFLRKALNL
ncbi:prolyl oligopeptidase family serine peptidase [Longispora sp. K20-0274]|uniref:prolyl oligopeptidase family serine peptidase n=1 Tax=Longispora sp. K20-0274 TaxID=3088255 RepID=UPI00399B13F8